MNTEMKLRFGRQVISVDEARTRLYEYQQPAKAAYVSLEASFGRTLAADILANHNVPHFRRSGVDGYAVRSQDILEASPESPVRLQVIERIPSGTMPTLSLQSGQTARIMTGAPVPDGADAVVMLEMTDSLQAEANSSVHIKKNVQTGSNITPIAGEIAQGETLIARGTKIGAGEIAILATFGYSEVPVFQKPIVAIFSTGSELLHVEQSLQPGKIRNSNSYMLAAQVEAAGGSARIMPVLTDDPRYVQAALEAILPEVDLILTSGGVSVGDYDVLVDLFGNFDGKLLFNKVAMRPGTPTSAAVWNGKLLLALSGNPGASFVGFELFAKPLIRAMMGSQQPVEEAYMAFLDVPYDKPSAYPRYIRGTTRIEAGTLWVRPAGIDKSSIMVSIKDADCLIWLPAGGSGYQRGDQVHVFPTK